MCGICGFINLSDNELIKRMAGSLFHRGPDEDGFYIEPPHVSLGMRRLKIIDLKTGSQPIYNEDKTIVTVFNGEIYNFKELRSGLESKGHRFATNTDTEVIVHLYEEYGKDCPRFMRGMFAFAVWDLKNKSLLIARDHLGIKPLFYTMSGGALLFASEIKSLLQYNKLNLEMDYTALDHYLTLLYVPAPLTIYKNIKKLKPGHSITFEGGRITTDRYWQINDYAADESITNEHECIEQIEHLLNESVREQMVSDVPIGVFLSGGIDSSTIVCMASSEIKEPLKTFNIGYSSKDSSYNEMTKARSIAQRFNCDHHEYIVTPDIVNLLPKIVSHFDEPFADSSSIPTFLVSRESRRSVTVALTGIGGDELFAGYPRYLGARLSLWYDKVPSALRKVTAKGMEYLPESMASRNIGGWAKRFAKGGLFNFQDRYINWITVLDSTEKNELYTRSFSRYLSENAKFDSSYLSPLENPDHLMKQELTSYLPGDLLCQADRMSMANSLELRVPFCDTRLVELMNKVPIALKTKYFKSKYLLRKILEKKLPHEILSQRKMGFQVPLGRWINEEIQPVILELLNPARIKQSGILNPERVSSILELHRSGKRNFTDQIYAMLIFELWRENTSGSVIARLSRLSFHGLTGESSAVAEKSLDTPVKPEYDSKNSITTQQKLTILACADVIQKDETGGSGRAAWELARNLKLKGHKVLMITRGTGIKNDFEIIDGIETYRYHSNPFKFRSILRSILSRNKIDVLHFHHPFTSMLALDLSKKVNALYMFYSPWHEEYEIRRKDLKLSAVRAAVESYLRKKIEKIVLLCSKKVITNSIFMQQKLLSHHGIKSDVLALGVDTDKFYPASEPNILRKKLNVPDNKLLILTIRNLASRMGIENLIAAMPAILKECPDAYCIIGGEGYLREKLENQIKELSLGTHLRLEGYIPDEILHEYYQCADIFVLPTKQLEGFGLVTLEAMSCGTPVIATPIAANKEVVGNFNNHSLFKSASSQDIAEGVIKFIAEYKINKNAARELSRKFVEENYSWKKTTEKLEKAFYELAK